MKDLILIRVPPQLNELKRYEVFDGTEPKGFVFQWMSQLNLAKETSRIRIDGKKRPFWCFITPDGRYHYRVKLETRKQAINWLMRQLPEANRPLFFWL